MRAGSVSNKYNILAVLEDSGRVSILPLGASEAGGVCGKTNGMVVAEKGLCEQKGAVGAALRFEPGGERLVGVDKEGKVVVVDFEKE